MSRTWVAVCALAAIPPDSGVCALADGAQVAVFRLSDDTLHAVGNVDPFSGAAVLARGIVGDVGGVPVVASPVYKQRFDLRTGQCLDEADVRIPVYDVRLAGALVEIAAPVPSGTSR